MNVRSCTLDDLEWLVEKANKFNDKYFDIPLVDYKVRQFITGYINTPGHVCIRTDHGAILGMEYSDPCRHWVVLVETAWYSEGRDGITLLREFERIGREELFVDEIRMTTLNTSPTSALRLLEHRGYQPIETSHRILV